MFKFNAVRNLFVIALVALLSAMTFGQNRGRALQTIHIGVKGQDTGSPVVFRANPDDDDNDVVDEAKKTIFWDIVIYGDYPAGYQTVFGADTYAVFDPNAETADLSKVIRIAPGVQVTLIATSEAADIETTTAQLRNNGNPMGTRLQFAYKTWGTTTIKPLSVMYGGQNQFGPIMMETYRGTNGEVQKKAWQTDEQGTAYAWVGAIGAQHKDIFKPGFWYTMGNDGKQLLSYQHWATRYHGERGGKVQMIIEYYQPASSRGADVIIGWTTILRPQPKQ